VSSQLLQSLLHGVRLSVAVPLALDALDENPLRSAGQFPGDLLRALMQVPGSFWTRSPRLYERYRDVLRRAAAQRRQLPARDRMQFWEPLRVAPPEQLGKMFTSITGGCEHEEE